MGRYGSKTKIVLNVTKNEADAALIELRREWQQADVALGLFMKRLQWFRNWRAYKYYDHSTFASFVNAEFGKSKAWLYQHLKALPIETDERRLLEDEKKSTSRLFVQTQHGSDAGNATCVKMGNCNNDGLKTTHKQRLAISNLGFLEQDKALKAVLEHCPGADIKTTNEVITKAIGRNPATPKKKPAAKRKFYGDDDDCVFDPGQHYRFTMVEIREKLGLQADASNSAIAKNGSSVIAATIQTLRQLAKTIRGWEPTGKEAPF